MADGLRAGAVEGLEDPLALKGVKYRPAPAAELLRRNVLVYGVGGLIVPFVGIKAIDLALSLAHLA